MTPQEKAKQQAGVQLAFADGSEIESVLRHKDTWVDCHDPLWNWINNDYRVKKPAPKVVKLEAWIDTGGELRRFVTGTGYSNSGWKRIPQLDMEYTEDES